MTMMDSTNRTIAREEWAAWLKGFSDRNASRLTTLEVDDPEIGAQPQEARIPLRGASYDQRDGRIQLMFGDLARTESHLTHTIEDPVALEVVSEPGGDDLALSVTHERGRTILRFLDA